MTQDSAHEVATRVDAPRATVDANEAVASVAYRASEVIAIYPITPASPMGEHAAEWAVAHRPNLWGTVPDVVEMQSEGGAAGAVHGALQAGALTTTFTASQGLLLMIPNLYKIAGELTTFCMHVAARAIATHALSIFGDHSDVMAVRGTGLALLASGSPQEAVDLAAIAHAATLGARVPFLHFFDGFRTSHELATITPVPDDVLHELMGDDGSSGALLGHRLRAMNPDHPVIRGTAQNPDTFFQAREASNLHYDACPGVVEATMTRFAELTGRRYQLFDYVGAADAERVVVMMGSGAECMHEVVEHLVEQGEKVGLEKVRLFRPFSMERLVAALPATVHSIAVLDRTKEPGSSGEPLLLDVTAALVDALGAGRIATLPRLIGGRYGLSSKEFSPAMAKAVLDELAAPADLRGSPRTRFTVGINDDVTRLSLAYDEAFTTESPAVRKAVFYGLGSDGTVSANKASVKIVAEHSGLAGQGHFVYDSKKSGSTTVSHLRFGPPPIRSTYEIHEADLVAVHDSGLLGRMDVLERAAPGATVLLNLPGDPTTAWDRLPARVQRGLVDRGCRLYVIDAYEVATRHRMGRRINTIMQTCFFALADLVDLDVAIDAIKESVASAYGKRGSTIVEANLAAIDDALGAMVEVAVPAEVSAADTPHLTVPSDAPDFVQRVTALIMEGHGDRLPVSAFPVDGTWPTGTSRYEKRAIAQELPVWDPDLCTECNHCSTLCPHTAIVTRVFEPDDATFAPPQFRSIPVKHTKGLEGLGYTILIAPDDCTGCGLCVEVCPGVDRADKSRRSLRMEPVATARDDERVAWDFGRALPDVPRTRIPRTPRTFGLLPATFEFSGACAGCGETPYIRTLTQLFGDHLVIANATGCSSIYGANLPTTPYTTDQHGRGPAWSNSLFEDNAEYALGLRAGLDATLAHAYAELDALVLRHPEYFDVDLLEQLHEPCGADDVSLDNRRRLVDALRGRLAMTADPQAHALSQIADVFVPRSVWAIGGDGWAYDIGYGGLDHVLSSGRAVKILVLDTEVYSNTGGQASKATPLGASAKFASEGKDSRKKDLGLLAMSYGNVYVASIALQARSRHAIETMLEAEAYPGPALVIAHSPCIAHGYDLRHSPSEQKRAIDAGAWPLYRYDPRRADRDEAPLVIDADPASLSMREYMQDESRFSMVKVADPERFEELVDHATQAVASRHAFYEQLADVHVPAVHIENIDHVAHDLAVDDVPHCRQPDAD